MTALSDIDTHIEKDHWVERYLADGLDDEEAGRFEAYWSRHPELTADIENVARAKTGLAELRARGTLDGLLRRSWWTTNMRIVALAASVALAVVGLRTLPRDAEATPIELSAIPSALPVGERVPILRLRAATGVDAVITLPPEPQSIELRVVPDVLSTSGHYAVQFIRAAEGVPTPASAGVIKVSVNAAGVLRLYVDSTDLRPGRYQLALTLLGQSAAVTSGNAGLFAVRVVVGARRP